MVFFVVIVVAIAIAAISVITIVGRRDRRHTVRRPPPLFFPLPPVAPPLGATVPQTERAAVSTAAASPIVQPITATAARPREVELSIVPSTEPDATSTVRFRRPTDDAVQLLPGRLEVVSGEGAHREIRFVRAPGERPEVILGRELGDTPGHVALQSSTVSRRHARLAYANGVWKVANLSQTNPVVVNDEALSASGGERTLADGDCLELGEVVLRFHAR